MVQQITNSMKRARTQSCLQVVSKQQQQHYSSNSQHHASTRSRNIPSNTARESAVIVEVEPVSELERRIEEGMNYEHFSDNEVPKEKDDRYHEKEESARGVFVGYSVTSEERRRLKSANVIDEDDS